jgi:pimeloyl-ACP methyl ester carboxylesterase
MDDFLSQGFIVAATDYQGLGTPGTHHYLICPSEAHSVLDSARVARRAAGASDQVILFGHSQGGHAVIFANEIAAYGIDAAAALDSICVDQLESTYGAISASSLFVDGAPLPTSTDRYDVDGDTTPGLRRGVSPMLMLHGRSDDQVPPAYLVPWVESTCALGQTIQLEWFNTGHRVPYEAPQLVSPVIFDWIEGRIAGRAAPSNCNAVPQP